MIDLGPLPSFDPFYDTVWVRYPSATEPTDLSTDPVLCAVTRSALSLFNNESDFDEAGSDPFQDTALPAASWLSQQPLIWAVMPSERLAQLLVEFARLMPRCRRRSRLLNLLVNRYLVLAGLLSKQERIDALQMTAEEVQAMALHPVCLLLFLFDHDVDVIADATRRFVLASPLEGGQSRAALAMAVWACRCPSQAAVRGIIHGLVGVGDLRLLPVLYLLTGILDPRNARLLIEQRRPQVVGLWVGYLLVWLHRLLKEQGSPNADELFGVVAAALGSIPERARLDSGNPSADRRSLPAFDRAWKYGPKLAAQPAHYHDSRLSLYELGQVLAPLFHLVEDQENHPRVMPHVRRSWSIADSRKGR